ncbi:hypothetical protein N9933_00870 [bacterium]|nr:hypothetical protein [bacterium]
MKKILNILAIALLVFFTSCEQETIEDLAENPKRLTTLSVENPKNELDEVGKKHNEALAFILEKKDSRYPSKKFDADELIEIVMEYQTGQREALDEKTVKNMAQHYLEIVAGGNAITTASIDICKIAPPICNPGTPPYNPAYPTFGMPVITGDPLTNYKNAVNQVTDIKTYETSVLGDATLDDEAKNSALSYAATYRHSTQFWYNAGNLEEFQIEEDLAASPCKSCEVIQADAAGAGAGSLFGPWGSIIGGAIASAVAYDEIYN